MPTIMASIAASIAAWILDDLIAPYANLSVRIIVNLAVSVWVFFVVRRYLVQLRNP